MLNPVNLSAAFGLAKMYEEYFTSAKKLVKGWVDNGNTQSGSSLSQWTPQAETHNKGQKYSTPTRKISSIQMDEKWKRELCYVPL